MPNARPTPAGCKTTFLRNGGGSNDHRSCHWCPTAVAKLLEICTKKGRCIRIRSCADEYFKLRRPAMET